MLAARVHMDISRQAVQIERHTWLTEQDNHQQVYDDSAKKYTYAPVLTDPSRITPTFVRFSTVQGSRGSAVSPLHLAYIVTHINNRYLGYRA